MRPRHFVRVLAVTTGAVIFTSAIFTTPSAIAEPGGVPELGGATFEEIDLPRDKAVTKEYNRAVARGLCQDISLAVEVLERFTEAEIRSEREGGEQRKLEVRETFKGKARTNDYAAGDVSFKQLEQEDPARDISYSNAFRKLICLNKDAGKEYRKALSDSLIQQPIKAMFRNEPEKLDKFFYKRAKDLYRILEDAGVNVPPVQE